jgi:hypothetical protein
MNITGGCHCGNLTLTLDWPGEAAGIPARACDCSFCTRHGCVWTSHPDADLVIAARVGALVSNYSFATRTAAFHICARCGIVPVSTCRIETGLYAVVNVNTLHNLAASSLMKSPAHLQEEDIHTRLARRQRNWIAHVLTEGFSA